MSLQFNTAGKGLTRSGSYFNQNADWTILLWANTPVVSGPNQGTLYTFGDKTYVSSVIQIFLDGSGNINLTVYDGAAVISYDVQVPIDNQVLKSFGLTYNSTTHLTTAYINGTSVGTAAVNISTITFAAKIEYLFTDESVTQETPGIELFNVRTWQSLLTGAQLLTEAFSSSAVITANLLTDTPLVDNTNIADTSGNGRNWSRIDIADPGTSLVTPLLVPNGAPNNGNISDASNAIALTVPMRVIQNVRTGGSNKAVWFKLAASLFTSGDVIGVFGFGGLGAGIYAPLLVTYTGADLTAPVAIGINASNKPVQVPALTLDTQLILNFSGNAGNPAILNLDIQLAVNNTFPVGSIFVNSVGSGLSVPAIILSPDTNYLYYKMISPFVEGEWGDILPSTNVALMEDEVTNGKMYLYQAPAFNIINTYTIPSTAFLGLVIRSNRTLNKFYIVKKANPLTVFSIDSAGVQSATLATLTGNSTILSQTIFNDGSTLLFANSPSGSAVKAWDMVNNVALADFAAGNANYFISDMLTLTDGTIVIGSHRISTNFVIRIYNTAGTLLRTVTLTTGQNVNCRLAYALDDPNSFWAWTHSSNGVSKFTNIKVSDGSTIRSKDHPEYEQDVYTGVATNAPLARFGNSNSCPFFILPVASTMPNPGSGLYFLTGTDTDNPVLTHDVTWINTALGTSTVAAIPNPYFELFAPNDKDSNG